MAFMLPIPAIVFLTKNRQILLRRSPVFAYICLYQTFILSRAPEIWVFFISVPLNW